jgi:hypothetical protein
MMANERTFEFHGRIFPTTFQSFQHFKAVFASLAGDSELEQIPVTKPASNVGFSETWFRLKGTNDIVRIVAPDAPYSGECGPVNSDLS